MSEKEEEPEVAAEEEVEEVQEQEIDEEDERQVNEDYMVWKKNSVFLYDIICTHALEWPSLTVQWLPGSDGSGGAGAGHEDVSVNRMVIGTHTSEGAANYLMRVDVHIPVDNGEDEEEEAGGGGGGGGGDVPAAGGVAGADADGDAPMDPALQKSWGGTAGKIETKQKVNMDGEVHRARCMPQNSSVVAVKSPSQNVYLFNLDGRPAVPAVDDTGCSPDSLLTGHSSEGWALCWSPHDAYAGHLLSGSDDKLVLRWDTSVGGGEIEALATYEGHTDVVNDVAWHPLQQHTFGSVGDDRVVALWDARCSGGGGGSSGGPATKIADAHAADINCISFNPFEENYFVTGASDGNIHLWDARKLGGAAGGQGTKPMHVFAGHDKQVFQVQWNPHLKSVLGSCGADRRIFLWDMDKIGAEQSAEDAEDGPPEIVFVHGGHTSTISEFAWSPNADDAWTVASVAEDNIMQVWMMAMELLEEGDYDDAAPGAAGGASSAAKPPAPPMVEDDDLE